MISRKSAAQSYLNRSVFSTKTSLNYYNSEATNSEATNSEAANSAAVNSAATIAGSRAENQIISATTSKLPNLYNTSSNISVCTLTFIISQFIFLQLSRYRIFACNISRAACCLVVLFAYLIVLTGDCFADSWRMKSRDMYHTGRSDFTVPASKLNSTFFDDIIWQTLAPGGSNDEGDLRDCSPTFFDGVGPNGADILVGGYHWPKGVQAMDRHTGQVLWFGNPGGGELIGANAPAFSANGQTIYVINDATENAQFPLGHPLMAFSSNIGPSVFWHNGANPDPQHISYESPSIAPDGRIFGNDWPNKVAAAVDNGSALTETWLAPGPAYLNITRGRATLYDGDGPLRAISVSADGLVYSWIVNTQNFWQKSTLSTDAFPTIDPANGNIYIPGHTDYLNFVTITGLNKNGMPLWGSPYKLVQFAETGGPQLRAHAGALSHDGTRFYFQTGGDQGAGALFAIDTSNGSVKWSVPTGGIMSSDPAGSTYSTPIVTPNKVIIVGNNLGGKYYAIQDLGNTGVVLDTLSVGYSEAAKGSPILSADGKLYIGTRLPWTKSNGSGAIPDGQLRNLFTAFKLSESDLTPPGEVSNIVVSSQETQIGLTWQPPPTSDLAWYRVYKNGELVSGNIPAVNPNFTVPNLTAATGYTIRVTTLDQALNESSGVTVQVATLLPNPPNVTATAYSEGATVSWDAVSPGPLVTNYRIYAETAPFSSVSGLTPKKIVGSLVVSTDLADLENDTTYYIAVTTVNISGGETSVVNTVSVTPELDSVGPSVFNPTYAGAPLLAGATISGSGVISVSSQDLSGVSRVEFRVSNGSATATLGIDAGAGPNFSTNWNIGNFFEGNYTIIIEAFDTFDNSSILNIPVILDLAPPPAPVISAPVSGLTTNQSVLSIAGTSTVGTTVKIFNNGVEVANSIVVNSGGSFETSLVLNSGVNTLSAKAIGVGGNSNPSATVVITLDISIPATPGGLVSNSAEAGLIKLNWNSVVAPGGVTYDLYRSSESFSSISSATKVNGTPLQTTAFNDLPPTDGNWYYRVVSVTPAGNISEPSSQTAAVSDRVVPFATSITYASTGVIDETGHMGPGLITVVVTANEQLLTAPFLTYAFSQGAGIPVALVAIGNNKYQGSFVITPQTSNGSGVAVFSARDMVNNQGTVVQSGANILVDSHGPQITTIEISPSSPIKNDAANPPVVTATFHLDEAPVASSTPVFGFKVSSSQPDAILISEVSPTDATLKIWQAQFTLPTTAGQSAPEALSFTYSAQDSIGNIETQITVPNIFQVYQGELPPLAVPTGLTAKAQPDGKISLSWNPVAEAIGYQLFRQEPGTTTLDPYGALQPGLTYVDSTTADGEYLYAIASMRQENGQQALSAPSAPVSIIADSIAPLPPMELTLQMNGQGVAATWLASNSSPPENLTYRLYRDNLAPGVAIDISDLTPVIENIISLAAIDSSPSELEHAYAVTAVDQAGNESIPSNTSYLNFALLPVSSLNVVLDQSGQPKITWSYSGTAASKFRLTVLSNGAALTLYEGNALTYTDTGYNGAARLYTVTPIDSNSVEGVGRSILLPKVDVQFPSALTLQRGIFNRLDFTVTNQQSEVINGAVLVVTVNGVNHLSAPLVLAPGVSQIVPIVVGGYANLADQQSIEARLEITPQPAESVKISTFNTAAVSNAALPFTIETQNFIKGATGQVRLVLNNTSAVTTELVTALNAGGLTSNEIRFVLKDSDGNIYAQKPILQFLGESVVTLANGITVARVDPGATFTSAWMIIDVPQSVPDSAILTLEVDKYHSKLGTPEHVEIAGLGTTRTVNLVPPPYNGELISITPVSSFDEEITIKGRAINTTTAAPEGLSALQVVLTVSGFKYTLNVVTDSAGEFTKALNPADYAAGIYKVSIVYPGTLEAPEQGSFAINRISATPSSFQISTPTNYVVPLSVAVTTGPGTLATGVKLQYLAQDQGTQTLPEGIIAQLPEPIEIAPGTTKNIPFNFAAENKALVFGQIYLRLVSNETGSEPIALIPINYTLSSAAPSVSFVPPIFETGVAQGNTVSGSVKIQNNGLAPLIDAQISLLSSSGQAAPNWAFSSTALFIPRLEIGESYQVDLFFSPGTSVSEGVHEFLLRVTTPGEAPRDLPLNVGVNQDGKGNLLVHASDIYTATLDENNQPIPGLAGADLTLQHELLPGIQYSGSTDTNGEFLFTDIPAGSYILRGSSPGHNDAVEHLNIYPEIAVSQELFLNNQVITIEWSVVEIVLQDFYQIVLNLIFETNVPVAVAVLEPPGIQLPSMKAGEVFLGELTLTNYGFINAINVEQQLPSIDNVAQFEFLATIPSVIAPGQRIYIPYRITALSDFDPPSDGEGGVAGGNGSAGCGYSKPYCVKSASMCANGTLFPGYSCSIWFHTENCGIGGGGGFGGWGGAGGVFGGGGGYVPSGTIPLDLGCIPGIDCSAKTAAPNM